MLCKLPNYDGNGKLFTLAENNSFEFEVALYPNSKIKWGPQICQYLATIKLMKTVHIYPTVRL